MITRSILCALGFLFFEVETNALGQDVSQNQSVAGLSSQPVLQASQIQSALQAFQEQQQALAASFQQLAESATNTASSGQIVAWHQQYEAQMVAQRQRAQAISAAEPLTPTPLVSAAVIPADASETMQAFLSAQVSLQNARAQIRNAQLQNTGTVDESAVEAAFRQQNAAALQAQKERAQTLAEESDANPIPVPPPLVIPSGASATYQQFLSLRDQLMRGEIQVHNQNLSLSYTNRAAALQQWYQQNASSFQQLRTLAQNLSANSSN